jgi:hypothetical protein
VLPDRLQGGCGPALRRHYGWGFRELEQRWREYAFAAEDGQGG